MTYYAATQTYEFTAYTEADLLKAGDHNLGVGDKFTVPSSATACFSVVDNDRTLSGDAYYNEKGDDTSYQTAGIEVNGEKVFDNAKIYAEKYFVLCGSDGKYYYLIEIEVKDGDAPGEGDDFFTFYGDVPPHDVDLHIVAECNVTSDWIDYKCLDAGIKWELDEDCTYTIEAEDLALWNFHSVHGDNASGNELIKLSCHDGKASTSFGGESGSYDIKICAQDETDGASMIKVFVNGVEVGVVVLDESQGNNGQGSDNGYFTEFTLENIQINEGDKVELHAWADGGEFVRIDKIAFEQIKGGDICGTVFCDDNCDGLQDQGGGGTVIKTFEAESMWHENYHRLVSSSASGHEIAKLNHGAHEGKVGQYFDGPTGTYDVVIFVQDENDGQSTITLLVDDVEVEAIRLNGDTDGHGSDNGPFSQFVIKDVSIEHSDWFKLAVQRDGNEFVRIDKVEFRSPAAPSEAGKEGVLVTLLDANGQPVLDDNDQEITTLTDANGNYKFEGLPAGDYRVKFTAPDGQEFTQQDVNGNANDDIDSDVDAAGVSGVISVTNGGVVDVDAGLKEVEPGAISGTYFCDVDRDGADDGAANGDVDIAGQTVMLFEADGTTPVTDLDGNQVAAVVTDSFGNYRFDNLAAGDYVVMFEAVEGKTFIAPNATDDADDSDVVDAATGTTAPVTVRAGEETENVDAGVEEAVGKISGKIFCDDDCDGVRDAEEAPKEGIVVKLHDVNAGDWFAETVTDENGCYHFGDLPPGIYQVMVVAPEGFSFTEQNVGTDETIDSDVDEGGFGDIIILDAGDEVVIDAGLKDDDPRTGQIGDTVWLDLFGDGILNDENLDPLFNGVEQGVPGVTVELLDAETGTVLQTQQTDENGNYLFTGLAGGNYIVDFVLPEGFEFTIQNAGADDARDSDADRATGMSDVIALEPGGSVLTVDAGLLRCGLITGTSQADRTSPARGNDLLLGCETDDTILGFSGDDTLLGEGGNDVLEGESFRDSLDGGTGDDSLFGGTEDDILAGGLGDDFIDGGENDDIVVFGGNAADATISLSSFADREIIVVSEEGTDVIRNAEILRFADGDVGVDTIIPGGARDEVEAPAGPGGSVNIDVLDNDVELSEGTLSVAEVNNGAFGTVEIEPDGTVTYTAGADFAGYDFFSYTVTNGIGFVNTIEVQVGELPRPDASDPGAIVLGDDGVDFEGGDAGETIIGGAGDDDIDGNRGSDVIDGLAGDDALTGGRGFDLLLGGTGNDRLVNGRDSDQAFGESGNDRFLGQEDDDILFGGTGIDEFSGQSGSDFMVGGAGDDIFEGLSSGADIAIGGAGNDTFFWRESSDAGDRDLIDGESGVDQLTIVLSGTGADATAVQAEVDAYLAIVAANEPPAGSINDGSVITGTYSFTTIDLDLKNVEDVLIA